MNEKLSCYASGDGSLSFVWLQEEYSLGRKRQLIPDWIASGRKVMLIDVENFLSNGRGAELLDSGMRLYRLNGDYCLATLVERLSRSDLKIGDTTYSYTIMRPDHNWIDFNFMICFRDEDDNVRDVKNLCKRSAILFFLKNEEEMLKQDKEFDHVNLIGLA